MAKVLGIPIYYFYTSGVAALAIFLYFPKIMEQTTKSFKDMTETILEFPSLKSPLNAPICLTQCLTEMTLHIGTWSTSAPTFPNLMGS
ncbi:hypothetical protein CerSpe_058750 [Prunus speciosa]